MIIRKYVGTSERGVMDRIRRDLGPDAVILHTSYTRPSGMFARWQRMRVEVVAGGGFKIVRDYPNGSQAVTPPTVNRPAPQGPDPERLRKEIAEIKQMIARQSPLLPATSVEMQEEHAALVGSRVSHELAKRLIERIAEKLSPEALRNRAAVHEAVRRTVKDMVRCADGIALQPGKCVRVAFIGPTGVGKTTTIAKLISIYAYRGQSVGVITNDTYRIAATEQVRRVAQLVGVPLRVCRRNEDVEAAVKEFESLELVLIDTAGRSQKNTQRIGELKQLLAAARPDETHLVVSMTSAPEQLVDIVQAFSPCEFDRIVLTKLDEAVKAGLVLDVLSKVSKALSFFTTGQEIPRDIEIADSERLTSLILGEEAL
jgi:flagellar biosynthesis protein FlhF